MRFVKSGFGQKLIIILIALMIFNFAVPKQVSAWDIGGVLLKPISSIFLAILVVTDVTLGIFLIGGSALLETAGTISEALTSEDTTVIEVEGKEIEPSDILVGPDTIFCGKVSFFDANIFQANSASGIFDGANMRASIKEAIAKVYVLLRNICALIMLAGLIFTGIRILVSSNTPQKQAHWRAYLFDWLIGLVLLIFSHILMYAIFYVSDTITYVLAKGMFGAGSLNWELVKKCLGSWEAAEQIMCLMMLGYLIYLTVIFAVAYFKRLLWICVLIVIAPIVSIMYAFGPATKPIYSKWLREYITTVLVQPFHMIVYSVLVSMPLNLTESGSGFQLSGSSLFSLIYALGAMSFIRPAEKYIRSLFGMNQGLANMASFDSGKQTVDAVKNYVVEKVQVAAKIAGGVATGNYGMALQGAAEASKQKGINETLQDTVSTTSEGGTDSGINEATPKGDMLLGAAGTPEEYMSLFKGTGDYSDDEIAIQNGFGSADEMLKEANFSDEEINSYNDSKIAPEDSLDNPVTGGYGNTGINGTINTSELSVIAGNVNMQGGSEQGNGEGQNTGIKTKEEQEDDAGDNGGNNDGNIGIKSEGKEEKDKDIRKGPLLGTFMRVATGREGVFEALSKQPKTRVGRFVGAPISKIMDSKAGKFLTEFEKQGGVQALHEGFNSLRDTFFEGGAPGDWKNTNTNMKDNLKAGEEQKKFEFINSQENKWLIEDFEVKLRAQYPNTTKYPDAFIKNLAIEKAKEKLKSLADTYVPLGITNNRMAYECDEDRKKYGLTAQQAVQQRINYEKFNISSKNIAYINDKYSEKVNSVSEAIEPARDYYNNGYNKVQDMALVKELTTALNVSYQRGMQLDQVLRRKGGQIDLKNAGLSKDQEQKLNQILNQYKEIQRGKK